ncbi:MAG: transketolase family protein [Anaerolineae bacterium]|nr:transketolase family protein [Anaerolineae bacterium]
MDFILGKPTRLAFGEALLETGREDPNIVVVDGDVNNSTRTDLFAKEFPERFFNFGIAESNLVGVASGLAASGKTVFAASFACFIMCNGFDQLRMSVAFPNLNVKIVGSHSGISIGEDGPSQMGIEDVALACALPNFVVLVPADEHETRAATRAMARHLGPAYMRTGRPKFPLIYEEDCPLTIGVANLLRSGDDVALIANGLMVSRALQAAETLAQEGIEARVLYMHTVKPIDRQAVITAARETGAIVTAEEHLAAGGMGTYVLRVVAENYPVPVKIVAIEDTYAQSGKSEELLEEYGLTAERIVACAKEAISLKG